MIWSGKAPNGFIAGGVPVPGSRPIGGHRAAMTVHPDEGEPSSSGSTGEGSGVASDQMDVPEDHCEANVCISAGVKDKMVTRPKRKTGKDMPSGVVVDVSHERRGKRKRTPKQLPDDEEDPTKIRLPGCGVSVRASRPRRTDKSKKATTAPNVQKEAPHMVESSQPLLPSPTAPTPDHPPPPTDQAGIEILLKMTKEEADRLAMPPPPLPEGFVINKAAASKKAASKPKAKPKPKAKGKRAKVTKAEREAAAKEKEEANMQQWNYDRFMREHGWMRQINPFYLPGQGSPWLRERGENGNESSSESDDENEDWERWAATDAFKAEPPKRGGELLLYGLDVAMATQGHKDGTPDRIEEEGQAEEEERPSKMARVMETDLSRLGEGEGDATMADTLLWMERMEEWWAGMSMPSPTWPPIQCEMMADGLLQDSDLFAFE
ncbi:unnamed protein product [Vitrella brassicaformis CCMP3155]|uniref:Uncharacterized protein n=1 Tax=Vitrella brassicaformis (strain CCMP3155) TaxID=1169540 RepID=A0A0G4G079_VITBC|nr:unnamed protein product [Vitrella brassicaformis CCMP3155]|eukprot:CEM20927.1 unnamed protein product [Vitrella brassicaformis CCMP3155]